MKVGSVGNWARPQEREENYDLQDQMDLENLLTECIVLPSVPILLVDSELMEAYQNHVAWPEPAVGRGGAANKPS